MKLEFHPIADCFPLIEGNEFDELVADVKKNGIDDPIWLYEGKILDGRNRYLASQKARADCPARQYKGDDPITFVVSKNLHRRHQTKSQLAFTALAIERIESERAKERMREGGQEAGRGRPKGKALVPDPIGDNGQARDKAAAAVGVSPRYVSDAKKIEKESPRLAKEIKAGKTTIKAAKKQIKAKQQPAKDQTTKEQAIKFNREVMDFFRSFDARFSNWLKTDKNIEKKAKEMLNNSLYLCADGLMRLAQELGE